MKSIKKVTKRVGDRILFPSPGIDPNRKDLEEKTKKVLATLHEKNTQRKI